MDEDDLTTASLSGTMQSIRVHWETTMGEVCGGIQSRRFIEVRPAHREVPVAPLVKSCIGNYVLTAIRINFTGEILYRKLRFNGDLNKSRFIVSPESQTLDQPLPKQKK